MRLTIHRGSREIGGSCIEVAAGPTRLILDVGMPLFDSNREPFDSFSTRKASRSDLIARGIIPAVPGLFDCAAAPPDAILLSHAHLDHSGLMHHSRPEIPIHATVGTSKMMLAGQVFAAGPGLSRDRYRPLWPGSTLRIGSISVTPFAVDHSAFDSVSFLLEAEGRSLLYTGDLRMHGRKPDMARDLVRAVAPKNVDALLVEGTHFGRANERRIEETDVERVVTEKARSTHGLVLAAFSPQDVDRLMSMYKAARKSKRVFVADAYAAFVLHLAGGKIPKPTAANGIRVFFNAAFRRKRIRKLESLFAASRIELSEILSAPDRHLMVFRPSMLGPDFGNKLPGGSTVIYSCWSGYLARPEWAAIQERLRASGGELHSAHASGHIHIPDLIRLVTQLNTKTVIPIHTFEPDRFRDHFRNVTMLPDGIEHEIGGVGSDITTR